MYSPFRLAIKYVHYYLTAANGKGHGTHSPFIFEFITKVLNDRRDFYSYRLVEALRKQLLADQRTLEVEDMGAGSGFGNTHTRHIADIAKRAAKPAKYGQLLFRIVNHYQCRSVLELGTSLGLTTAYLAFGNAQAPVITCEGSGAIAAAAQKHFAALQLRNIDLRQGNFDHTLPGILAENGCPDLVFFDGNHRKAPTLHYFEQCLAGVKEDTIFIFDDIHWSAEMEAAWKEICAHPQVRATVDLFFVGIVFFRKAFKTPQHFVIRY
jgi:predicted O-methyltransferase YrrM